MIVSMGKKPVFALTAVVTLCSIAPLLGGSLQTSFTTVRLRDLLVGHWTKLELPGGEGYSIENTSDRPVTLAIGAAKPKQWKDELPPSCKAIPDTSWIQIKPARLVVGKYGTGRADVSIHVPADEQYANQKYEFWLIAKAVDGQFGVGLITRVRFNTVKKTEKESQRQEVDEPERAETKDAVRQRSDNEPIK